MSKKTAQIHTNTDDVAIDESASNVQRTPDMPVSPKLEPGNAPTHYRLWINDQWYIPVDETGLCIGPCAEGALGFVVQLRSPKYVDRRMALKLPRLMGETHRENAYISDLLEKELAAVQTVIQGDVNPAGLLYAEVALGSLMRGPINTLRGTPEAQSWDNAIIFTCYEKGQNPRFCLVKRDGQNLRHFPEQAKCPVIEPKILDTIEERVRNEDTQQAWANTAFLDFGELWGQTPNAEHALPRVFAINQALTHNPVGRTWYTCLPSIMYGWAPGTLQEAISLGKRNDWAISDHLLLIEKICRGLLALHTKAMLHADLRPANIVYQGSPADPINFSIADYGSFAETTARPLQRRESTGQTIMGPVVGGERTSAFYAPERKSGREREAADTAVIITPGDGLRRYIVLGWRSNLIDAQTGKPVADVQKYTDREYLKKLETKSVSRLANGDRLQVREYIFDVCKEWNDHDKQIIECEKLFWKIYHSRIVVESTDQFAPIDWLPIPRTIELLQWSASTDLYSLGALALYSVYFAGFSQDTDTKDEEFEDEASRSSTSTDTNPKQFENSSELEEDFRVMLDYLASQPYFNAIWPELESLRQQLEKVLCADDKDLTAEEFAAILYEQPVDLQREHQNGELPPNFQTQAVAVVSRITQTAPGTRRLVAAFDYELGKFVFFIHFVLCCLHRQSDMDTTDALEASAHSLTIPFCKNRFEKPEDGAAGHALTRLEFVRSRIMEDRLLSSLRSSAEEIPDFDPRPDPTIRIEIGQLRDEMKNIQSQLNAEAHRREASETALNELHTRQEELHSVINNALRIARESGSLFTGGAFKKIEDVLKAPFFSTPVESVQDSDAHKES